MSDSVNYPDVLGAITGGPRVNVGVVQAAVALRPRVIWAGRAFEVIVLLQNASDVDVDVIATLRLPEQDASKKKGRFLTKSKRLLVGLKPAETGYVAMPAMTLADATPSDQYKLEIELDVKPLSKPARIRSADGGGAFDAALLNPEKQALLDELKGLTYSTKKLLGRNVLELQLPVMAGSVGQLKDFKAGWFSICRLSDYADLRPMMHRYGDMIISQVLPHLKRNELYKPFLQQTTNRWKAAGVDLQNAELVLITKLMTIILEYATPNETAHGYIAAGEYAIKPLLERNPLLMERQPVLPYWFSAMLRAIDEDPKVVTQPVSYIDHQLYDDVLRDAIQHGFDLVETATGEDLGTRTEMQVYAQQIIDALHGVNTIDMSRMYLPLILAGLLISERMPVSKETPHDLLAQVAQLVEKRRDEADEDEYPIYDMANDIINRTGMKYGIRT